MFEEVRDNPAPQAQARDLALVLKKEDGYIYIFCEDILLGIYMIHIMLFVITFTT